MDKTQLINVKNRSAGMVSYRLAETGARRVFAAGETKRVPLEELEQLTWQAGGKELIAEYLQLENPETTTELNIHTEPEYWMSEEEIINLLQTGTQDEFLDTLDFAPAGVIDLIKDIAVKIRLNDYDKREALKKKTGFDVSKALTHLDEEKAEANIAEVPVPKRRVQAAETATPGRRVEPKYNIVTKK